MVRGTLVELPLKLLRPCQREERIRIPINGGPSLGLCLEVIHINAYRSCLVLANSGIRVLQIARMATQQTWAASNQRAK